MFPRLVCITFDTFYLSQKVGLTLHCFIAELLWPIGSVNFGVQMYCTSGWPDAMFQMPNPWSRAKEKCKTVLKSDDLFLDVARMHSISSDWKAKSVSETDVEQTSSEWCVLCLFLKQSNCLQLFLRCWFFYLALPLIMFSERECSWEKPGMSFNGL